MEPLKEPRSHSSALRHNPCQTHPNKPLSVRRLSHSYQSARNDRCKSPSVSVACQLSTANWPSPLALPSHTFHTPYCTRLCLLDRRFLLHRRNSRSAALGPRSSYRILRYSAQYRDRHCGDPSLVLGWLATKLFSSHEPSPQAPPLDNLKVRSLHSSLHHQPGNDNNAIKLPVYEELKGPRRVGKRFPFLVACPTGPTAADRTTHTAEFLRSSYKSEWPEYLWHR